MDLTTKAGAWLSGSVAVGSVVNEVIDELRLTSGLVGVSILIVIGGRPDFSLTIDGPFSPTIAQ